MTVSTDQFIGDMSSSPIRIHSLNFDIFSFPHILYDLFEL